MLYRTAAIFIVLFWLTMTALLVHQELRPGDSALRELPPAHVVKLLFMHQETSKLNIYSDKLRLGQLIVEPKIHDDGQSRDLEFRGDLQLLIPGGRRERVAFHDCVLHMDKLLNLKRFELSVDIHVPTDLTSRIVVDPAEKVAHYELRGSHGIVEQQTYTLDERGARLALESLGVDPSLLPVAKRNVSNSLQVKARQATLSVPGGQMDTYQVTVETNGQTLFECHVDQLGRIVQANTLLGYTLSADATTP
jgi:hypothetical protein